MFDPDDLKSNMIKGPGGTEITGLAEVAVAAFLALAGWGLKNLLSNSKMEGPPPDININVGGGSSKSDGKK